MGDDAWRAQPKLMTSAVVDKAAAVLGAQYRRQKSPFSVVLHGGEPLLLGPKRLAALCKRLREELPRSCGLHLQTNGVLLTDQFIDVFIDFDVGVSVSIDGPEAVHDRFRKDHKMQGSFSRVRAGIDTLVGRQDASHLFAGVLCVIDPQSEPQNVYSALKETGAPSLDFLVRDGNWDKLPFGKQNANSTEYGEWLARLLEIYLGDPRPPRVRVLDDMLRLLLGGKSRKEGVGTADYGIIVIEPDGRIDKNDTLKVAFPAADRFEHLWSVFEDNLSAFLQSDQYERYFRQQRPTSKICTECPDLSICGGGMVAHRWSGKRGFDNPSVFCSDQRHLIAQMRSIVSRPRQQDYQRSQ